MKGLIRFGIYQVLSELQKGKRSIQELRNTLPLYGVIFDYVISYLLSTGLAKKTTEGGVEYLEITDLGKSVLAGFGPWGGPNIFGWGWGPHLHHGRHGWWW